MTIYITLYVLFTVFIGLIMWRKLSIKSMFKNRDSLKIKPHCLHDWGYESDEDKKERQDRKNWEYARRLARGE